MNIDPILKALAAALAGDGPAVQLIPGDPEWALPGIELVRDAGSSIQGDPAASKEADDGGSDAAGRGDPAADGAEPAAGGTDAAGAIAVVVATSGSTGKPKQTLLSTEALAASSMATAMALGGEGQWLLALPPHYVAGIQVLVRSLFAGTRPVLMDRSGGFTAEAFTAAAAQMTDTVRYVSLVPTQLQRLLDRATPETLAVLRRFNAILLGGAPAGPALLDAARDAGVRVVASYGMSETCGGCVYDGVLLEGVRVAIRAGRIWLGGDVVASGYRHAPELTGASFSVAESIPGSGQDAGPVSGHGLVRWYKTEDAGELSADGKLTVTGRIDDVIITGGLKVSANLVAERLKSLDDIRDAFVLGLPDREWGQRVAAAVVGICPPEKLQRDAAEVLDPWAVPKTILFVPEIPMLPTGKPDRLALKQMLDKELNRGHSRSMD